MEDPAKQEVLGDFTDDKGSSLRGSKRTGKEQIEMRSTLGKQVMASGRKTRWQTPWAAGQGQP